jgi:hypothetical protein
VLAWEDCLRRAIPRWDDRGASNNQTDVPTVN